MNHIVFMAKSNSLDYLVNEKSQSLGVYPNGVVLKNLKKIFFNIFKHKVEATFPFKGLFQKNNIFVLKQPQHFNFPHNGFFCNFVLI